MARRRRAKRKDVLDWWQSVLEETKEFVDDSIDRLRDDDDEELENEVDELKKAMAQLNAKLDQLLAASPPAPQAPLAAEITPPAEVAIDRPANEPAEPPAKQSTKDIDREKEGQTS